MIQCSNCRHQNRDGARFCALCRTELFPAVIGGDLRVLSEINTSGMRKIYKAERQGRHFAVKELNETFIDPQAIDATVNKFLAEALILARLKHASIPVIHRLFIENDRYYLVMDWVEGKNLSALMAERSNAPLPEDQVLDWALQLCDVLECLHSQEPPIIFRDLNPANIIVQRYDSLVLVGFDIGEPFVPGYGSTRLGTPGNVAPEQYKGLAEPRIDIYALGVTLYYLLTGLDPQQQAAFNFPPIRSVNAEVSPEVEFVVHKAMKLGLEDRWASVGKMRQGFWDIFGALSSRSSQIADYRVVGIRRFWTWGGSRRMLMALDVKSGIEYGIFSLGDDYIMDALAYSLAGLNHAALPYRETVADEHRSLFICEKVTGVSLTDARIQDEAMLTSVGLELCSLFSEIGDLSDGFRWLRLSNIIIDGRGKVRLNVLEHFIKSTCIEHADQNNDDILAPIFWPDEGEVEVVAAVARAMWGGVTRGRGNPPCSLQDLLDHMPSISRSLAALIVGVANQHSKSPCVKTLSELREYLINPPLPGRAQISRLHVDFGTVERGETRSRSIRLSSLAPGLLYAEIANNTEGLSVRRRSYAGFHPCHWDIDIELDTKGLTKSEQDPGQITIVTPVETFQVTTKVDVHPTRK